MSSGRPRVALYHDFAEERLFGVRFYAERLHTALAGRCDVVDIYPRPRTASFTTPLGVWLLKSLVYAAQIRGVVADVHHVLDQSHADLLDGLPTERSVVTCHDLYPLSPQTRRSLPVRFLYRRRVTKLRRAARVVAVSSFVARTLSERLEVPSERIVVVRHPLDRFFLDAPGESEAEALRSRLALPKQPFVLHVGASWAYKNLETAIRGLGELARRRTTAVPLVKAGAPLTRGQRRLAAAVGARMIELGERSRSELRVLYRSASLLLYPSWEEGWGWPVAEAMAAGLPVVCSRGGALEELAGDAAFTVEPGGAEEIAAAVARILDDPRIAAELADRGRARAAELAETDFGGDMGSVYASVLEESAR